MSKVLKKWYPFIVSMISLIVFVVIGQILYTCATIYFEMDRLVDVHKPVIIVFASIYCIAVVSYTLFLHRVVHKRSWKDFGFRFGKKEMLVTTISIIISFLAIYLMVELTKEWGITIWRWSNVQIKYIFGAAIIYFTVGLNEEFYFRGYLYKSLTNYGKVPAYIVSGLVFVMIHFLQQTFSVPYLIELLLATFLLIYTYDITGSIWPGVLIHWAVDLFLGFFSGNSEQASLIIWIYNLGSISISDLLMWASIVGDIVIILLFYFMYRLKSKKPRVIG